MALKCIIKSLDEVAEPLRGFYAEAADGRYALALDGDPAGYVKASKLAEFRDSNRALNNKVTELAAKLQAFEGLDPSVDDSAEFEALEAKLAAEQTAHAQTKFTHAVATEFLRAGGRASAVDYMVANAAKVFAMKDGVLTTNEFSAVKPGEPLTLSEWMQAQTGAADFAFLPSRGGGAPVGGSVAVGKRIVSRDPMEFGQNLAAIARGEVTVE